MFRRGSGTFRVGLRSMMSSTAGSKEKLLDIFYGVYRQDADQVRSSFPFACSCLFPPSPFCFLRVLLLHLARLSSEQQSDRFWQGRPAAAAVERDGACVPRRSSGP